MHLFGFIKKNVTTWNSINNLASVIKMQYVIGEA